MGKIICLSYSILSHVSNLKCEVQDAPNLYFICYTVKLISLNFIASNCVAFFFSCAASVDKTHLAAPFTLCASKCVCFRSRAGEQLCRIVKRVAPLSLSNFLSILLYKLLRPNTRANKHFLLRRT